ncbi:hypothetical protein PHPALM_27931 [Phytophthora palmivora]|uniref:Uncharacterized protein n=1 Tax=Phytophthora palmivora TaxID=4796 RepID=A0A2P4XBD4_9STRA|nr:hypothetical protein PHPALM_27931 [Phytophthora palmivora]
MGKHYLGGLEVYYRMESVTDQVAQFSLGEVQKVGVASTYSLRFRKMISMSLELEYLNCLVLEKSSFTRNEFTQRRAPVKGSAVENAYGNSWLFVFHKKISTTPRSVN